MSLAFSPSETALGQRGIIPIVPEETDDRGVLSDVCSFPNIAIFPSFFFGTFVLTFSMFRQISKSVERLCLSTQVLRKTRQTPLVLVRTHHHARLPKYGRAWMRKGRTV